MCDFPSDPLYTRKIFGMRFTSQGIEWLPQYGHDGGINVKEMPAILGPTSPALLAVIGAGLIAFAAVLFAQARRERIDPRVAWTIAVMDIAWVVGSAAVVEWGVLTAIGNVIVAAVAAVVLVFAILEVRGASGLRTAMTFTGHGRQM